MDKNRLKILVIDDEAEIISELTDTITAWGRHNSCETVVDSFTSIADSGVCNYMEFSLIILDIRIGDDNGIDFAKSLRKKGYGATIAFISNYEQYAISGYAVHAITYILKPLDHSKIYELLDDAYQWSRKHIQDKIRITVGNEAHIISTDSIVYVKGILHYVDIHWKDPELHKKRLVHISLKEMLDIVENTTLVQCHRSYIVNTEYIEKINRSNVWVSGETEPVPIGDKYAESFRSRLFRR